MYHPSECHNWTEAEWLQQLQRRAARLTSCADDATDLAHDCLCAFVNHFGCYPWEYADPLHAWRWCCLKLRARFVAFFGYDPSNRAFESLMEMKGTNSPSVETGGDGDESDVDGKQIGKKPPLDGA